MHAPGCWCGAALAATGSTSALEVVSARTMSCGIFPSNNSEKKQRKAKDNRVENPIIIAPKLRSSTPENCLHSKRNRPQDPPSGRRLEAICRVFMFQAVHSPTK